MPGVHTRCKPVSASETSASDEASKLETYLQRQLEDDIARIFDESLYSDLEVVCGKLKVLTHSCILKARTNRFYHKLDTILHVKIERDTFDEIYSFVSDIYTECNIKHQENEIIAYLQNKIYPNNRKSFRNANEDTVESEVFLTPKCLSPYSDATSQKTISSSPSTELTREYYALVPIEGNILEKELLEQDVLSNAFQSIKKYQSEDLNTANTYRCTKPTSLSLSSSHTFKTVKRSNSSNILSTSDENFTQNINTDNKINSSQHSDSNQVSTSKNFSNSLRNKGLESSDRLLDSAYSPDSLITDDLSSFSDYLSAAYTLSPGKSSTVFNSQLNVEDSSNNMENIFPSSDSGLENTGLLESLDSHKDVTLTDVSLTESALQESAIQSDEANNSNDSTSSPLGENNYLKKIKQVCSTTTFCENLQSGSHINQPNKYKENIGARTSKEEKQRQNEEIITLESSSLSSEAGSWESVFPPKLSEKNVSQKFINNERQYFNEVIPKRGNESKLINYNEDLCPSLVQKSPFRSTSCFIDAASLVDGEDETIRVHTEILEKIKHDILPAPSEPVPFCTVKPDISPNDWSQSNDNEDSLEQADKPDPDSIQKDLSPTIFDMTPITEDSLCTNAFENAAIKEGTNLEAEEKEVTNLNLNKVEPHSSTVIVSSTPNNSIMSLKVSAFKQYESEESESDVTTVEGKNTNKLKKYNEFSPIVSGGASIEDHLPQVGSFSNSPMLRRKIENTPIVSGAYIPEITEKETKHRKVNKSVSSSAWVVDMCSSGSSTMSEGVKSVSSDVKRIEDRVCENLKTESNNSKSRSSVDSDSSERSSHKFYIDLSILPDTTPPKKSSVADSNEKKNIFSMYIDLGDKSSLKNMPARLSSSFSAKKENVDSKASPKPVTATKDKNTTTNEPPDLKVFEKYETLCNNPDISITEIIKFPKEDLKVNKDESSVADKEKSQITKLSRSSGIERSHHRSNPQVIQEESTHQQSGDLFVKLSDLDKTSGSKADMDIEFNNAKVSNVRMTRSIPDNNWGNSSHNACSRPIEVISSFHSENALSLNRLFPHLKNEFSRSMPGSLSSRTRSPFRLGVGSSRDLDEPVSDVSEISSVQSSTCRSVVENSTTEESSQMSGLIGNCQSRLGQDLLRMFLEEIAPDVIVEVSGRRIKAHKCILSSRCQYFAGILSGGWVQSAGNVIVLPPFSFNVVHFALCHIYSGVSTIPDTISIVELATIADMLGLEGLKEAIMFTLKAKYCHHFHKPCPVCTAGVLECFPLSSAYGLDDLYRKCLRWITKHFTKVWPTKAFATLPKELLDKCYQQHIINLTIENFVETVYGCGITVASLQSSRWSESVARMCRRLVNAAAHFAAPRLELVMKTVVPVAPDTPSQAKQALDDCLTAAIVWAPPDETCRAYAFLSVLLKESRNRQPKPDLITRGKQNDLAYTHAGSWKLQCEGALVRLSPRVVATRAFKELPPDLRNRLRELGCIMYDSHDFITMNAPVSDARSRSYHGKADGKHLTSTTRSLDIDHVRASFVPYTPKPAILPHAMEVLSSNNDLRDTKKSRGNPPIIRTTKAQEERAKFNLTKNTSQDRLNGKAIAGVRRPNKPTKSRYLEPKACQDEKNISPKKFAPKMLSSSESSRNSSPIQSRNLRTSRMRQGYERKPPQTMSQDSLATSSRPRTAEPSTDSLSESQTSNKYATYTKVKHTAKGSVESIKSSTGRISSSTTTTRTVNNKMKTKIPVYVNQGNKSHNNQNKTNIANIDKRSNGTNGLASSVPVRTKPFERKIPGSLMNATKSSSAKMVPKINKDLHPATNKSSSKTKGSKHNSSKRDCLPEIPVMERSGTFLKDEPTFGDITTNIDIDK